MSNRHSQRDEAQLLVGDGEVYKNENKLIAWNRHLRDAIILSLAFFGLFVAYSTIQNLESSLGDLGSYSVSAIYGAFCFSALFVATPVNSLLPPKWALIVGGSCYLVYTAANLYPRWETMIPGAIVLGIGAGILWAAQGSYLTAAAGNYADSQRQPTKAAMGLFTGIFFGIFQMTQVVGNSIGSCILMFAGSDKDQAKDILFYTFLGIGAVGVFFFLFLGKEPTEMEKRTGQDGAEARKGKTPSLAKETFAQVSQMLKLLFRDKRMLLLVPTMYFSGLEQGFVFNAFTTDIVKASKGEEWIGFVMSVFGALDAIGSVLLGRLGDKFTKRIFVIVGVICHVSVLAFYITILYVKSDGDSAFTFLSDNIYILFITAGVLGVADSCWNTFPPIMMSVFFIDKTDAAFSNLKFWQSVGSVSAFVWGPRISFQYNAMIVLGVLAVAVVCLCVLDFFVASIDSLENEDQVSHINFIKKNNEDEEEGRRASLSTIKYTVNT